MFLKNQLVATHKGLHLTNHYSPQEVPRSTVIKKSEGKYWQGCGEQRCPAAGIIN